jgi:transposase
VAKLFWAKEWAKEGKEVNWQRLMAPRGFQVLARRWVVERTFAWSYLSQPEDGEDGQGLREVLCATGEAFV